MYHHCQTRERYNSRIYGQSMAWSTGKFWIGRSVRSWMSLVLDDCSLSGSHIAKLLTCRLCPRLVNLQASWRCVDDEDNYIPARFHDNGTASSNYASLLTHLKLEYHHEFGLAQFARLRYSLQNLQHLAHVSLGHPSL